MGLAQILAAGAMRNLTAVQDVISDNLANASTTGFRRNEVAFGDFAQMVAARRQPGSAAGSGPGPGATSPGAEASVTGKGSASPGAGPAVGSAGSALPSVGPGLPLVPMLRRVVDPTPGALLQTGNPLDLAMQGEGYLAVLTPQGERYVRGGSFQVDASGRLCTHEGWPLLAEDGSAVEGVGADAHVTESGTVVCGDQVVATLRRVTLPTDGLVHTGGAFGLAPGATPTAADTPLRSGCLESANVRTVGEMVHMIETLRTFELLQQVVRADDEMQQRATDVARAR